MAIPDEHSAYGIYEAVILVIGSILTTILTIRNKDRIQNLLRSRKPKDRFEMIFDGYERLVSELQGDLAEARRVNKAQGVMIQKMQRDVNTLSEQLALAQQQNKLLISSLQKYEPGFTL